MKWTIAWAAIAIFSTLVAWSATDGALTRWLLVGWAVFWLGGTWLQQKHPDWFKTSLPEDWPYDGSMAPPQRSHASQQEHQT